MGFTWLHLPEFICVLRQAPESLNGTYMPIKHREIKLNRTSTVQTIDPVWQLLASSIPDLPLTMPLVTPIGLLQSKENSVLTQHLCSKIHLKGRLKSVVSLPKISIMGSRNNLWKLKYILGMQMSKRSMDLSLEDSINIRPSFSSKLDIEIRCLFWPHYWKYTYFTEMIFSFCTLSAGSEH